MKEKKWTEKIKTEWKFPGGFEVLEEKRINNENFIDVINILEDYLKFPSYTKNATCLFNYLIGDTKYSRMLDALNEDTEEEKDKKIKSLIDKFIIQLTYGKGTANEEFFSKLFQLENLRKGKNKRKELKDGIKTGLFHLYKNLLYIDEQENNYAETVKLPAMYLYAADEEEDQAEGGGDYEENTGEIERNDGGLNDIAPRGNDGGLNDLAPRGNDGGLNDLEARGNNDDHPIQPPINQQMNQLQIQNQMRFNLGIAGELFGQRAFNSQALRQRPNILGVEFGIQQMNLNPQRSQPRQRMNITEMILNAPYPSPEEQPQTLEEIFEKHSKEEKLKFFTWLLETALTSYKHNSGEKEIFHLLMHFAIETPEVKNVIGDLVTVDLSKEIMNGYKAQKDVEFLTGLCDTLKEAYERAASENELLKENIKEIKQILSFKLNSTKVLTITRVKPTAEGAEKYDNIRIIPNGISVTDIQSGTKKKFYYDAVFCENNIPLDLINIMRIRKRNIIITIYLVGQSGSGKSTNMFLILDAFFEELGTQGNITVTELKEEGPFNHGNFGPNINKDILYNTINQRYSETTDLNNTSSRTIIILDLEMNTPEGTFVYRIIDVYGNERSGINANTSAINKKYSEMMQDLCGRLLNKTFAHSNNSPLAGYIMKGDSYFNIIITTVNRDIVYNQSGEVDDSNFYRAVDNLDFTCLSQS